MATFADTWQAASATCSTTSERLQKLKVLLDATETALFDAATGGAVRSYRVNTGQTTVDVEVTDIAQLQKQYTSMLAFYNEMCGIVSGSNVMVMRNGATINR